MTTGLMDPYRVFVKRSQPSSILWCAMQPRKTLPGRSQLAGEAVGVLAVIRVEVVEGRAIEDQVVGRPFALRSARRVAAQLKTRVAVMMGGA